MRFKFSLFCNTSSPAPGLGTVTSEPKVPADTPVPGAPHPTLGSPMRAAPVWGHPVRPRSSSRGHRFHQVTWVKWAQHAVGGSARSRRLSIQYVVHCTWQSW